MAAVARQHAVAPRPTSSAASRASRPRGAQRGAVAELPVRPLRPVRRERPAQRVVATRRHGGLVDGPQPLVRATVGIRNHDRHLAVVPEPRGRRFAGLAVVASIVLGCAMLGAAAFQTQLAQRQVELDQLDSDIEAGREQYELLRRQRAELRSPAHLSEVAAANGMVPAGDSAVMQIAPDVMALAVAATGDIDPALLGDGRSTLDDFREVKATTSAEAETP